MLDEVRASAVADARTYIVVVSMLLQDTQLALLTVASQALLLLTLSNVSAPAWAVAVFTLLMVWVYICFVHQICIATGIQPRLAQISRAVARAVAGKPSAHRLTYQL